MTAPLRFPLPAAAALDGNVLVVRTTTPDFMDELGERTLGAGADGTQLQTLRLRREFAESSEFERALRIRFDEARNLTHPSLATVHSILRTDKSGLSLVSAHVAGKRVSAMSPDDWVPPLR